MIGNIRAGATGLLGQRFDLAGNHREPLACFAGAGSFDRRIQGQQTGLKGNVLNSANDFADIARAVAHRLDGLVVTGNLALHGADVGVQGFQGIERGPRSFKTLMSRLANFGTMT